MKEKYPGISEFNIKQTCALYQGNVYAFLLEDDDEERGYMFPDWWLDKRRTRFIEWMNNNLTSFWYIHEDSDINGIVMIITNSDDATLFKLTWC